MIAFVSRRLLHALFLFIGVSILSFVLADIAPGDFYSAVRLNSRVSADTVIALRERHGLTDPLWVRYLRWSRSVLKGEWGYSFAYNGPAGPIIWPRARNTILLAGLATAAAWLFALPLGAFAAARRHSWADWLVGAMVSALLAIPELVLGLLLLLFAARTHLLPVGGFLSLQAMDESGWAKIADIARHIILPVICLTAGLLPFLLLHVRNALADSLASPFITAARGLGVTSWRLLLYHALPAAANPLISLFGLSLGALLSSSLLIEALFNWPGLGQLMVEAIFQRDYYLVIDATLMAASFFIMGNLLADVLLYTADPRIRS